MSDAVAVQTIATVGLVLVATLGLLGTVVTVYGARLSRRVKAIQGQVQNDHDSNLREDMDAHRTEGREIAEATVAELQALRSDIGGIRSEIRGLRGDLGRERDRIDDLEDTLSPRPRPPAPTTRRARREARQAYIPPPMEGNPP